MQPFHHTAEPLGAFWLHDLLADIVGAAIREMQFCDSEFHQLVQSGVGQKMAGMRPHKVDKSAAVAL